MKPRLRVLKPIPPHVVLLLAMIPLVCLGCAAGNTQASTEIFLDEAFVALYPELTSNLIPEPPDYSGYALANLEDTQQKASRQSVLTPIIASPLVAVGIHGTAGRIVSPFLPASIASVSGLKTVLYDYISAYEAIGSRAGRAMRRKARSHESTILCAVVFQSNSMRGMEALDAFRKGYGKFAEIESLTVEILDGTATTIDLAGAANAAIGKALATKPASIFLALDDSSKAIAAASEMKNILRFGDTTTWQETDAVSRVFEYWLEENAKGLAKSIFKLLNPSAVVPDASYVALNRRARFPRIF